MQCRILEKKRGDDDILVVSSINGLGRVYQKQDKYTETEELVSRVLSFAVKEIGLANEYERQRKYGEAEEFLKRAVAFATRKHNGPSTTGPSMLAKISSYEHLGRYEELEESYRLALTAQLKELGVEHPLVVKTRHNLAAVYRLQGKYSAADGLDRVAGSRDAPEKAQSEQSFLPQDLRGLLAGPGDTRAKRSPVSPEPSSTPAPARSWSRTGRSIPPLPPDSPPRHSRS